MTRILTTHHRRWLVNGINRTDVSLKQLACLIEGCRMWHTPHRFPFGRMRWMMEASRSHCATRHTARTRGHDSMTGWHKAIGSYCRTQFSPLSSSIALTDEVVK